MMQSLLNFFAMGGYAFYVWLAYGSVLSYLFVQWFIVWRKWQKVYHDNHPK